MNLAELFETGGSAILMVTATDLKEFALQVHQEAMAAATEGAKKDEQYLTTEEASAKLGVSKNTLWRWRKIGYLVPVKVGRTPYYKLSDIEKIMEG